MKFSRISTLFYLLVILSASFAKAELCYVDKVYDGDTVFVTCETFDGELSLSGIDAPDIGQPFAESAKDFLEITTSGQELILFHHNQAASEGVLLLQGGRNINARLVSEGYAWALDREKKPDNYLLRIESKSRKLNHGMWTETNNMPPWAFREKHQLLSEEEQALCDLMSGLSGRTLSVPAPKRSTTENSSDKESKGDSQEESKPRPKDNKQSDQRPPPPSQSGNNNAALLSSSI